MESFRFKCIIVSKTETPKGFFIKAINKNGPLELFMYGKRTPMDKMVYAEVAGIRKNANKEILTIKSMDIINRFLRIRESFSKLSTAASMMETAYKTKIGLNLLLKGLTMLETQSNETAFIWFMASFLIENGLFNKDAFTKQELSTIAFIIKSNNKERLKLNNREFSALSKKLTKLVEEYADMSFSHIQIPEDS